MRRMKDSGTLIARNAAKESREQRVSVPAFSEVIDVAARIGDKLLAPIEK